MGLNSHCYPRDGHQLHGRGLDADFFGFPMGGPSPIQGV